jgi:acetylornithine/N-succinyldiaminopimelate aminotransferase
MTAEFARELNGLCRAHDVVLIADEVQTGLSRTGTLYASQGVGLEPDIITLAKPLAAGLPLAATLLPARINDVVHVGEHGTTFGGGPVTCAVALEMWKTIADPTFIRAVAERGEALGRLLEGLARPGVGKVKGKGLLRGLEVTATRLRSGDTDVMGGLITACREAGLLILRSGSNVLRIAPPLVISHAELEEGVALLGAVLGSQL